MSGIPDRAPAGEHAYAIEVQVDGPYADRVSIDALVHVAENVLRRASQPPGMGLTVVITDDDRVRALNRVYRGEDSATDVLSFAATEGEEPTPSAGPAFVTPDGEPPYLGDVIISFPAALTQASAQGQPVGEELRLLVAHGCLHLLGYDHVTPEEEAAMWALQAEALSS